MPKSAPNRPRTPLPRVLLRSAGGAAGVLAALAIIAWAAANAGRTSTGDGPPSDTSPSVAHTAWRVETAAAGLQGDVGLVSFEQSAPAEPAAGPADHAAPAALPQSDEERRARALGEWEDDYRGKRRLSVRGDGTATMVVEPAGAVRKLFGDRLEFQIEWTLQDGRLAMTTIGGEPKSKTRLILTLYGDHAEYTVLSVDDERLMLLDADGQTQYEWRRVAPTGEN